MIKDCPLPLTPTICSPMLERLDTMYNKTISGSHIKEDNFCETTFFGLFIF